MKLWQVALLSVSLMAIIGLSMLFPGSSYTIPGIISTVQEAVRFDNTPIEMVFVGDMMLSRSVGDAMLRRGDWVWPFARIASLTSGADLAFGNLETTVSTRGTLNGCGYCFRADPRVVEGLTAAGFDLVSLANNHMWDYGIDALVDTVSYMRMNRIRPLGAGYSSQEARDAVVVTVRGVRIAFLAYTDILPQSARATDTRAGVNLWDEQLSIQDIARARTRADVVIVSFHTGTEYEPIHNSEQERIYHAIIDADADMVIGSHPHVVQDVERYQGKWILYSLGNFVFDQNWSDATRAGLMVRAYATKDGIQDVEYIPVEITKSYQATAPSIPVAE